MPIHFGLDEQSMRTRSATLAHELGHALYSLPDTYVVEQVGGDTGGPVRSAYPGCAGGAEQATEWFGDLVGTVDPFFDTWEAEHARYGIPLAPEIATTFREMVRVALVPDGCFGPEGVAVRSSRGGLMVSDDDVPLLNAVERRWAERGARRVGRAVTGELAAPA